MGNKSTRENHASLHVSHSTDSSFSHHDLGVVRLIDLGFQGPRYTWVNKQDIGFFIQERLDRAFANQDWMNLYPEASVTHLTRVHSDHCPILLCLDKPSALRLTRPFRFQPVWMSHPLFEFVLENNWASDLSLNTNLLKFSEAIQLWNKGVFGNIFQRKRRVVARLAGIQKAIGNGPNAHLLALERELREEY